MAEAGENISVVVRMRNLIEREKNSNQSKSFSTEDSTDVVQKSNKKRWTFDRVYSPKDDTRSVYATTVCPLVEATVSGFNSTIFAYGQTSSGKTFTMHGTGEEDGVIQMAVDNLFFAIEESPDRRFLIQVSFMEIYNEVVNDLLSDPKSRPLGGLKVKAGGKVDGIEAQVVNTKEEIFALMKKGEESRHTGKTKMNDRSSRSHTIFRIILESTERSDNDEDDELETSQGFQVTQSQLNLVDLAGSERAAQTGATGARLKEGANINTSLMFLGQVIGKLSSGEKCHVNYRDSKLTHILQNSLGGNAKTAIICAVTPAAMSEEQTVSTLRFATQAKAIKNHAQVNEVLDDAAKINRMKKEMAALKAELDAARVQSVGNREAELQEALDEATKEKENLLVRVLDANEKILTSSQAASPRKSMMPTKTKSKVRRETWCGRGAVEKQRLEELDEEEEQLEDSVFPEMLLPVPVSGHQKPKKRTGTFASSPSMFVSPLRKRQDEKLLLSRKLSDMEQELQKERALRMEAENNVQKVALRLEASLFQEGQEKSELMVQCQILAKEVEMSRETVEALSLEVKKWRRMAQDGRTLNEFFSAKEAKEVRLPNPEPLLEVNHRNEEISDLKASEEMEVGVSGEAGRRKGEALDLLRIQEDDENPKSGSRMDFGEKKVFFQKKIEAEISSPSLRERK